jgi:hypothetical protein
MLCQKPIFSKEAALLRKTWGAEEKSSNRSYSRIVLQRDDQQHVDESGISHGVSLKNQARVSAGSSVHTRWSLKSSLFERWIECRVFVS